MEAIMLKINPFQLASRPDITIYLREATVADCEYFAGTDSANEERLTNEVMNHLQYKPEAYVDPCTWTSDDRRLAALWYFVATTQDTSIHAPYICPHCSEEHDPLIDVKDIASSFQPMQGRPYREIEHEGIKLKVTPRDGFLMTELEEIRELNLVASDADKRKNSAIIKRHDLVGTISFMDKEHESRAAMLSSVESWVRDLSLSSFEILLSKRDAALLSMQHGLATDFKDGQLSIITTVLCEKEDAGVNNNTVRLRIPFRIYQMLPRLL